LKTLVGVRGIEPPTPASRRQCSTRLSYTPTVKRRLYPARRICKWYMALPQVVQIFLTALAGAPVPWCRKEDSRGLEIPFALLSFATAIAWVCPVAIQKEMAGMVSCPPNSGRSPALASLWRGSSAMTASVFPAGAFRSSRARIATRNDMLPISPAQERLLTLPLTKTTAPIRGYSCAPAHWRPGSSHPQPRKTRA
jgi:hypothetical protein